VRSGCRLLPWPSLPKNESDLPDWQIAIEALMVGPDHLKMFADADATKTSFEKNDAEGVAFRISGSRTAGARAIWL
jgi:hypothetical protein